MDINIQKYFLNRVKDRINLQGHNDKLVFLILQLMALLAYIVRFKKQSSIHFLRQTSYIK